MSPDKELTKKLLEQLEAITRPNNSIHNFKHKTVMRGGNTYIQVKDWIHDEDLPTLIQAAKANNQNGIRFFLKTAKLKPFPKIVEDRIKSMDAQHGKGYALTKMINIMYVAAKRII